MTGKGSTLASWKPLFGGPEHIFKNRTCTGPTNASVLQAYPIAHVLIWYILLPSSTNYFSFGTSALCQRIYYVGTCALRITETAAIGPGFVKTQLSSLSVLSGCCSCMMISLPHVLTQQTATLGLRSCWSDWVAHNTATASKRRVELF